MPMKVRAICCEIVYREVCRLASESPLIVDVDFLPKGLHNIGAEKMSARVQEMVDAVDEETYDATVLGYGLCNNGVAGLKATRTKLIVPRAHDCITFLLGSRRRYQEHFDTHPGTYYHSTGWRERNSDTLEDDIPTQLGMRGTYEEYVEKYGEENARYIMESLGTWQQSYSRITYIDMGLAMDDRYAEESRADAEEKGWEFERVEGDWRLLRNLLEGDWNDEEFLTVEKGDCVEASYDDCILRCPRR